MLSRYRCDVCIKIILETGCLSRNELVKSCEICQQAGAACVKTSTGIFSTGADPDDIVLMRSAVGETMDVKASGGIRTYDQTLIMLDAGASKIGTSAGIQIINQALEFKKQG